MNNFLGVFFSAAAIFFAALPFVALFLAMNAVLFMLGNNYRRKNGQTLRVKPWVFKTENEANRVAAYAFFLYLVANDLAKSAFDFCFKQVLFYFT